MDGKTRYEVTGLTASGKLAMVREVDKVGLDGTFQNSTHIQTGADGFSKNGTSNPLDPLHARARSGVSPSDIEEISNVNNEGDDSNDDWVTKLDKLIEVTAAF